MDVDPDLAGDVADLWEGVLFLGGRCRDSVYSQYYHELKREDNAHTEQWNVESNIKLYALEAVLRLIQKAGYAALADPQYLLNVLEQDFLIEDRFYTESRSLRILSEGNNSSSWQIEVPIYISEITDGSLSLVRSESSCSKSK